MTSDTDARVGSGEDDLPDSGAGERSRSWTIAKAGRVARIAGVIIFGSEGRFLDMDLRISRDLGGGEDGGEAIDEWGEWNYICQSEA